MADAKERKIIARNMKQRYRNPTVLPAWFDTPRYAMINDIFRRQFNDPNSPPADFNNLTKPQLAELATFMEGYAMASDIHDSPYFKKANKSSLEAFELTAALIVPYEDFINVSTPRESPIIARMNYCLSVVYFNLAAFMEMSLLKGDKNFLNKRDIAYPKALMKNYFNAALEGAKNLVKPKNERMDVAPTFATELVNPSLTARDLKVDESLTPQERKRQLMQQVAVQLKIGFGYTRKPSGGAHNNLRCLRYLIVEKGKAAAARANEFFRFTPLKVKDTAFAPEQTLEDHERNARKSARMEKLQTLSPKESAKMAAVALNDIVTLYGIPDPAVEGHVVLETSVDGELGSELTKQQIFEDIDTKLSQLEHTLPIAQGLVYNLENRYEEVDALAFFTHPGNIVSIDGYKGADLAVFGDVVHNRLLSLEDVKRAKSDAVSHERYIVFEKMIYEMFEAGAMQDLAV